MKLNSKLFMYVFLLSNSVGTLSAWSMKDHMMESKGDSDRVQARARVLIDTQTPAQGMEKPKVEFKEEEDVTNVILPKLAQEELIGYEDKLLEPKKPTSEATTTTKKK